ncbi:MAG: AMP-binding protein, partial [Luminiphilus sp.]
MSDYTKPYFDAVAQLTAPTAPFEVETVEVAGIPLKAFKNAERSLGAFLAAGRKHDANLFLQYQGEDWTYNQFFNAVDQACDWLVNEAQIQKGDPIAIAMRNRPEWLVAFVATVTIGAVAVPLNSWGKAQELTQGLEDSKAKLVFCDSDRLTFIRELNSELPAVVVDESEDPQDTLLSEIRRRPIPSEPLLADVDRHDPAILMFTSGTSGRPKGALLSHFNCCQALMNVEFIGAGTYMTNMEEMNKQLASPTMP